MATTRVDAANAAPSAGAGLKASSPATTRLSTSSAEFDRFLTLLTAQMKFQDPLSPTDPTQFVAQLAQFSQVEQQVKSNTLLQTIASALSGEANLAENAALLGKAVQTEQTSITVPEGGAAVPLSVTTTQTNLTKMRLEVLDARNDILRSLPVSAGTTALSFDGKDGNGNRLAAGRYTVRVVGDDSTGTRQTAGIVNGAGKITEIRRGSDGALTLVLDNGSQVSASDITRLGS